MTIFLAVVLIIGVGLLLKKLVATFGGPNAEPMSYWDSFGWILAPRLICRGIFYLFPTTSKTTPVIVWAAIFLTLLPLALNFLFKVPLLRAFLISLAAMVLLTIEVLAFWWNVKP